MPLGLGLVDDITTGFLTAMETGGTALAHFAIPLLAVTATISFYREYGLIVMQGGDLGDALASFLLIVLGIGGYFYLLTFLFPLATAALATVVQWGLAPGGGGLTPDLIRKPSFILEVGLKAAGGVAEFDTWFKAIKSTVKMASHPGDLLAWWAIVLSFMAITGHQMMLVIEYQLAVMCAVVLIPWGLWRSTSGVAEFALGWLTGGLIRALVGTAMVGIALPLFTLLKVEETGFFTLYETVLLVVGSFLFMLLCFVIPSRAARMAGHASLGLTGSTLVAGAMTLGRFGTMAGGLTRAVSSIRGNSALLGGK
jgi:type IV secretory pathway TrbL component